MTIDFTIYDQEAMQRTNRKCFTYISNTTNSQKCDITKTVRML